MRPIHLAQLDKSRPVLVLTRELARPHMNTVTVAPITTTNPRPFLRGPGRTGQRLNEQCVVACDHVTTVPVGAPWSRIGRLPAEQETKLKDAIHAAFDLE